MLVFLADVELAAQREVCLTCRVGRIDSAPVKLGSVYSLSALSSRGICLKKHVQMSQ